MKKLFGILICLLSLSAFGKPQIYFNYKTYYTPENSPFVSTSLQFIGGSFKYKGDGEGNLQASVEITQVFSKNDSIIIADKYLLNSPLMADSTVDDFYDIQRYALEPGKYVYELIITDAISGETVTGKQTLEVAPIPEDEVVLSGIEFIADAYPTKENNNFTKSGYFILPHLTNYYPPEFDKIAFYTEIYHAQEQLGADAGLLLACSIEDYISGKQVNDLFQVKRLKASPVTPCIMALPITQLPSGDYNLTVAVIDKNNDTLTTKSVFFQRRNDLYEEQMVNVEEVEIDPDFQLKIHRDSVPYYLGSIMPISERYEYESIRKMLKGTDTTLMEKYFYSFWQQTNPTSPYRAWQDYKKQVYYAERMFGTQIKYGWETDRGRIHLKYGSPNAVVDRPSEPSAYPYQIWHYYRIGQRSNIRFVFYNPDLVTNDYPLLHSDMQGELQNYRWEADLHKRDTPSVNVDDPGGSVHYGGNSGTLYRGGM